MEPPTSEIQYTKNQPSGEEPQKRKKYTRKKNEPKPAKTTQETTETVYKELNSEINSDLIHYTYKLEYELTATKKKLKHQRKKFRHLIHSLAKYFDAKSITSQMIDEYVKLIGAQTTLDSDSESDYQKLFSTHKFQVVEDSAAALANNSTLKQTGVKSTTKPVPTITKQPSTEITAAPTSSTNDVILIQPSAPDKQEKQDKQDYPVSTAVRLFQSPEVLMAPGTPRLHIAFQIMLRDPRVRQQTRWIELQL